MEILFSDSTTKDINNCPVFLWMDDARRSDFPGNQSYSLMQYCSLTLVTVHMLSDKLKLHEILSILSLLVYVMSKAVVWEVNKNTNTDPRHHQRAVSERRRVNISTSYLWSQGRGKQFYLCYLSFLLAVICYPFHTVVSVCVTNFYTCEDKRLFDSPCF